MNIAQIRAKYPQYSDLSDKQLADALHGKFYSDIPIGDYYKRIGFAPETTILGQVKEGFKGLLPGAVGLVESAATGASALLPEQYEKAAREKIASIAGAAKAPFAAAPGYEETVGRKLGEAVGSTVPFLAAGPLGLAGRIGAVGLGVGAGAGEARTRAEKEGATAEQRGTATALGVIPGALEAFAPLRILSRIPDAATAQGVQLVKRALIAGGEEAAQEAASGFAQNLIARGVYKPEQELIEGLGEQAAYGGATGAIVQGLMDLALGRRARGAVAPPPEAAPGVPGETPIERAAREAAEKAPAPPALPVGEPPAPPVGEPPAPPTPPEVPIGKTAASEVTKEDLLDLGRKTGLISEEAPTPPIAETPAPPIEEPKVRKVGEPIPLPDVLDAATVNRIGFSRGKVHDALVGKSVTDPEIRTVLEEYLNRPTASTKTAEKINAFLARLPEPTAPAAPPTGPTEADWDQALRESEPAAPPPAPLTEPEEAELAKVFAPRAETLGSLSEIGRSKNGEYTSIQYQFADGQGRASILVAPDKTAHITDISLGDADSKARAKGAGSEAYKQLGLGLASQGITLRSTSWSKDQSSISPAALRVWQKLAEAGLARQVGTEQGKVLDRFSGLEEVQEIPLYEFASPAQPETPSVTTTPTEPEAGGAGAPVAGGPAAVAAPEGAGAVEPTGVVPPVADVGQPAGREEAKPAAVVAPTITTPAAEAPITPKEKVLKGSVENRVKALNVNAAQGGVPDPKVIRSTLESIDEPKMARAVLYYLGVDQDGNFLVGANNLPQTPSAQEAAQMAGLGENSGDRVKKVAKALGITGDIRKKYQASQTDTLITGKAVSESGTGARLESQESGLITDQEWYKPIAAKGLKGANHTELARAALLSERFLENEANIPVFQGLMSEAQARAKRPEFKSAVRSQQEMLAPDTTGISRGKEAEAALLEEPTYEEDIAPGQEEAVEEGREEGDEDVEYRTIPQSPVVTNRASHAELEKVVTDIGKMLGGKVAVTILDDVTDVDAKQKPGSRAGATIKGGIYLFRSGIAKGIEGQKTIFHELFHKGLKNLLPEAEYRAMMNKFYSQSAEIRAMADAYLASDVGKGDTKNLSPQDARILAVEESLAEIAEKTDLKPTLIRQVGNFLARVADRLGMSQLARAIRTMGLNEQEKFIRDALQAGMGPNKAGEGAARFRPGTSAFKRWFGDSKVVDENGKPLVVYHGTVRDFSTFDAARAGQATGHRTAGWGFFFSANPQIAEIFAGKQTKLVSKPEWTFTTPEGLDKLRVVFGLKPKNVRRVLEKKAEFEDTFSKGSNLMSTYLSIQNPKELSAEKFIERFVEGTESAQRFIEQAKKEGHDGVVIRAGRSGKYKFEGSEYAADAWVAFRPEQIKSATGNVGAYGQRSITKEEAERVGMTQEEAAKAQAAGDIRFRTAITPEAEKAAAEADAIGERKRSTLTEKVGRELQGNTALRLREKFTDSMAALEDFFVNAYGGQIRTAGGRLNPMVLLSRALDALRVSKAVQEQGGLGRQDGLIVATELKNDKGESISYQGVLKRIADAAKAEGKTYEEYQKTIDNVLYGHREFNLRERNKTLDADEQVDLLLDDKQIDALEAAFQKDEFIKGVSADLDAIRFNLLDTLVETGRISKEQAQDYKDAVGYIPFERIGDYENAWTGATRGANRGAAALKKMRKLEGSNRKSTSVVENFSGLVDWATKEAMKNEAASRALEDMVLLGAAKRGPKPATDSPGDVVKVYENGKEVEYYVPDPAHFVAFSIADPQLSKILKAFQRGAQVLRAGVTSMPPFAIKQVFDDVVRAYTYAGVKNNAALVRNVLFNFPKNWMNEILKRKPEGIRELEALGIVGTFDFSQQGGNLQNILEGAGAKKEGLGSSILRVMEAGAKASDVAVREAIYKQVLKETGDKAQAESAAREIINFSRRGSSKMMGQMISIIPFFNAYARGMDKLATAAAGKVVGQTTGTARSMFYSRMAVLTAMGLAYALMMQDDEEYNKLPDHVRDTNWILPYGKELGFTPAIPIPADLAFFFKAIPERLVRYYKYQGTDEERTAMEVLGELTKRGIDVFSSPNITPQILRPFIENMVNYSWFLGRPLESQAQLKLRPFERYGTGTSDAMKAVAEILEDAANKTGIEAFAVSPIKLENAVRGLLGSAAGLSLSVADMVVNPSRTDRPLHQQLVPQLTGAAAVMKNPVGTRYMDEIYSLENRTEQVYGTYNRLKENDPDKAEQFLDDNIGMYEIRPAVRAIMKQIRDLNKMAMEIDKDTTMSPEERRKEIDELRAEQNEIARVVFSLRKEARDIQMGL